MQCRSLNATSAYDTQITDEKNDIASQRRQTVNVSIDQNIWKHALITNAQKCRNHICKSRSVTRVRTYARTSISKSKSNVCTTNMQRSRAHMCQAHTHALFTRIHMYDRHTHAHDRKTRKTKRRIAILKIGYCKGCLAMLLLCTPPSGATRFGQIPAQQRTSFASPPPLKQFILPKCSTPSALVQ